MYRYSYCRKCSTENKRVWSRTPTGRDYRHRHNLKQYGVTPEQYEAMLLAQNGVCAICGKPETAIRAGRFKKLSVDHNHTTGQLRQLLCTACNQGIGNLRENPALLRAAADYLEKHLNIKTDR